MRSLTSTPRAVDDPVALYVHGYVPAGISEDRWAQVRGLVVDQVLRLNVGLETMRRCIRALAYLASWCIDQHVPLDVEHVLDPDTVERYCAEGLTGTDAAVSRVRGDLRRVGRTLTATARWEPLPVPLARTKLPPADDHVIPEGVDHVIPDLVLCVMVPPITSSRQRFSSGAVPVRRVTRPSSATTGVASTCGCKTTACCRRHTPTPLRP